jgi:hypothetical protein
LTGVRKKEILPELEAQFKEKSAGIKSNRYSNEIEFEALLKKIFPALFLDKFVDVKRDDVPYFSSYLFILFRGIIDKEYQVQLEAGIGGSEDEPNIRVCAYGVAGFQLLKKLVTNGIDNFRFRIFAAYNARVLLEIDGEEKLPLFKKNAEESLEYFRLYMERFYPKLRNYVSLEVDTAGGYETAKQLAREFEAYCELDIECSSVKAEIERMAGKHGSTYSQSLRYAFAHPLMFGDFYIKERLAIDFSLYGPYEGYMDGFETPDALISFGGSPERTFNVVRDAAIAFVKNSVFAKDASFPDVARLISNSGSGNSGCVYYRHHDDTSCKVFGDAGSDLAPQFPVIIGKQTDIRVITDDLKDCLQIPQKDKDNYMKAVNAYHDFIADASKKIQNDELAWNNFEVNTNKLYTLYSNSESMGSGVEDLLASVDKNEQKILLENFEEDENEQKILLDNFEENTEEAKQKKREEEAKARAENDEALKQVQEENAKKQKELEAENAKAEKDFQEYRFHGQNQDEEDGWDKDYSEFYEKI